MPGLDLGAEDELDVLGVGLLARSARGFVWIEEGVEGFELFGAEGAYVVEILRWRG